MTNDQFKQLLLELQDADWQAMADGSSIQMVEDVSLQMFKGFPAHHIVVDAEDYADQSADEIKTAVLGDHESLLDNYYRDNLLSIPGFNVQASKLLEEHGADAFAAKDGELPEFSFFVEGGVVVAEPKNSPRCKYGAFCVLQALATSPSAGRQVEQWLANGEAYDHYLGIKAPI